MRWRNKNHSRDKSPITRNNETLDSFLTGVPKSKDKQSKSKPNIIPKIKVPPSSGFQPHIKPLNLPFIYPNYPEFRQYQYSIAIKCITENTLVCLPTGLGKTHIASVLIFNYHLWFPDGLIFFLAPTKPLVNQQSMSLSNFEHYVQKNVIFMLTGGLVAGKRKAAYAKKRVFFCTPQTLQNDLKEDRLDGRKIVLIIFDQAHRGIGKYSYANIVKFLSEKNFGFRVVALSATPGNDHQKIQEVIENLQISHMIIKNEEDPDVKKYNKIRKIQQVVVSSTNIIKQIDEILLQYVSWPMAIFLKLRLIDRYLTRDRYGFNPKSFLLIRTQVEQRKSSIPFKIIGNVQQSLCFLKFLADSISLMRESGYESFKKKFIDTIDGLSKEDEKPCVYQRFMKKVSEHKGYKRIKQLFQGKPKQVSHPKLQKLRDLLFSFLSSQQSIKNKSKVIIFANLRLTCHQIHHYISQTPYNAVIKSSIFLGQAKTVIQTVQDDNSSKSEILSLTQKQQINLIQKYKSNEINTLISTSIGEEGLDIGEVDAIFCYQGGMSTIRMVQRMGRTGRKRDGCVYALLMEGKEVEDYENAKRKASRIGKLNPQKYQYFSFNPTMFEDYCQIPIHFVEQPLKKQEQRLVGDKGQQQNSQTNLSQNGNKKVQTKKKTKKQGFSKKKKEKRTKKMKQNNENSLSEAINQASKSQQTQKNDDSQSFLARNINLVKIGKNGGCSIQLQPFYQQTCLQSSANSSLFYDPGEEGGSQSRQTFDQNEQYAQTEINCHKGNQEETLDQIYGNEIIGDLKILLDQLQTGEKELMGKKEVELNDCEQLDEIETDLSKKSYWIEPTNKQVGNIEMGCQGQEERKQQCLDQNQNKGKPQLFLNERQQEDKESGYKSSPGIVKQGETQEMDQIDNIFAEYSKIKCPPRFSEDQMEDILQQYNKIRQKKTELAEQGKPKEKNTEGQYQKNEENWTSKQPPKLSCFIDDQEQLQRLILRFEQLNRNQKGKSRIF